MTTLAAIFALATSQAPTDIQSVTQSGLKDLTFSIHVERADQNELKKINRDFGQSYRFPNSTIRYKEPLKLRIEANAEDTVILYILNDTTQYFKIPRANLKQKSDLSKSPGRRQTPLEFGFLTPGMFADLYEAKFVQWDGANAVFDLTFLAKYNDKTRSRIWMDPQKKYMTRRDWFNQSGVQIATFLYENPQQVGDVWIPTKLTVKNSEDKVAGITTYASLKVNAGLDDSLFSGD